MKILKRNKQNELQFKSMLRYYIPDRDKFNFYLHEAGFELLDMAEQQGITTGIQNSERHYISYWIRKLEDIDSYPIEVVLKLAPDQKKRFHQQSMDDAMLPIHRVTIYSSDYTQCMNYFALDNTLLEENEKALHQACKVMMNKNYVPSEVDGICDTSYKKIIQPNKQ